MGSGGENVSGLGERGLFVGDDCGIEKVSASIQSCEPFSTAEGDCLRTVVVALTADVNADNVSLAKSSGRKKVEKDVIGSGLPMETATGRPSRKCKKITNKNISQDLNFFELAGRRRRSFFNRPRISDWGSWESIEHIFKQIEDADLNQNEHKKSKKAEGREGDVISKDNQRRASSLRSKKENPASTNRIRLKVTFGRSCSSDITPGVVDDHRSSCHTQKKSAKYAEDLKEKFEEGVRSAPDGHDEIATQKQVELLEAVDSRCLDPGTSPDSEVINMNSDSQMSDKIAEDDILNKEICVVSGEVSSSSLPVSSRKGMKRNIRYQDVNCSIDDKLPSPEIIDGTQVADQHRHIERTTNDATLSEDYISTTTENISTKTSESGIFFMEPPLQSAGLPDFEDTRSSGYPKSRLKCYQAMPPEADSDEQNGDHSDEQTRDHSDEQKGDLFDFEAKEKPDHVQAVCKNENFSETGTYSMMN